jgi:uracil phosphoribosyltransferase
MLQRSCSTAFSAGPFLDHPSNRFRPGSLQPAASCYDGGVDLIVVDHPLAAEQLTILRSIDTPRAQFRTALDALAGFLVYEACRSMPTVDTSVTTPLGPAPAKALAVTPLVVPVLRAGLGMLNAALRLLPNAETGFVGVARNEETFKPVSYVAKLPQRLDGRPCLVVDPMLATGGSLIHACQELADRGAPVIIAVCVLAAPEGIETVRASGLGVTIVTASIDSHLNDKAFIVPGLGDACDRQFGEG